MPAFHTHWLVALKAISNAPDYIKTGGRAYQDSTRFYRKDCVAALKDDNLHAFDAAHQHWKDRLNENLDAITCFSAYMLGACGPDFWTLPSEPKLLWVKPRMAEIHFDLGHYNRTHRQFELSIAEVGGPNRTDLQSKVQRSYFLGMATHIAADLVVHQLVNVVAGAYNLLEKRHLLQDQVWENEHGGAMGLNIWNTHNKVEHFWDSYVRYRYLGDHGPFWPKIGASPGPPDNSAPCDEAPWVKPLGFPTIEGLLRELSADRKNDGLHDYLREERTRFVVEKPLTFPWLFCDRVRAGQIQPFIYRMVVDKDLGSYRTGELSGKFASEAKDEAKDKQMKGGPGGKSEWENLAFFSSHRNADIDSTSFNFLNFKVCPNVERTRRFAANVFYDYAALGPFVATAATAAGTFLGELKSAYEQGKVEPLVKLRGFWNLDTGLGLRIYEEKSDTNRECITNLRFAHVFDELSTGRPGYKRVEPYLSGRKSTDYSFKKAQVFATCAHNPPFQKIDSVYEESDKAYLERIPVAHDASSEANAKIVSTSSIKKGNTLVHREIWQRLTLCLRASIADLKAAPEVAAKDASCEDLALFFLGDKAGKPGKPASGETRDWLADDSKILDYREQPARMHKGLQRFETRILVNTVREDTAKAKAAKREIGKGIWNNVVPYSRHEGDYGYNFAIGTGRKFVLHSIEGGGFDPVKKLIYYKNISPTEHVFFTLYPLVREGGSYWDIFSKNAPSAAPDELKKISGCGTVKIVLIYERTSDKSLNLCEAYIDGLKVPVEK
jgi:hypothetical protein